MTIEFDKYYIEADKQIDRVKNYLNSLGEGNLSKIYDLTCLLKDFCDRELKLEEEIINERLIVERYNLNEEIEKLKKWQEANQPTGICETCTAKSVEDMYRYKLALNEIQKIVLSSATISKIDNDQIRQILNIINKVKDKQ